MEESASTVLTLIGIPAALLVVAAAVHGATRILLWLIDRPR